MIDETRDCKHGRLKARCEFCDGEAERDALRARAEAAEKERDEAKALMLKYERYTASQISEALTVDARQSREKCEAAEQKVKELEAERDALASALDDAEPKRMGWRAESYEFGKKRGAEEERARIREGLESLTGTTGTDQLIRLADALAIVEKP